jgi:ankyrin repeat protein
MIDDGLDRPSTSLSAVATQAPQLNSAAYTLVQAINTRYREADYIDSILENPEALSTSYNPLGTTALHRAAEIGSRHLGRFLDAGADVHKLDAYGRSAVHYAASAGMDNAIRMLVDAGAWPDLPDTAKGEQPVHVACRKGHDTTVRVLCGLSEFGAPFSGFQARRLSDGFEPLAEASRWGHHGCVRALIALASEAAEAKARETTQRRQQQQASGGGYRRESAIAIAATSEREARQSLRLLINAECRSLASDYAALKAIKEAAGPGTRPHSSRAGSRPTITRTNTITEAKQAAVEDEKEDEELRDGPSGGVGGGGGLGNEDDGSAGPGGGGKERGLNPPSSSSSGVTTAVGLAAKHGHLQVLWILIQSGVITSPVESWFPLLDVNAHGKELRKWVKTVLDDDFLRRGLTVAGGAAPDHTTAGILEALDEALEPADDNEDELEDDGRGDY